MMRFCSLGSGSSGNAMVVEASSGITTTRVLLDCGFSLRELELRLARAGLQIDDLDAVLVTHEHGDHAGCLLRLLACHALTVFTSRGTWQAVTRKGEAPTPRAWAQDGQALAVGDLQVLPYAVPHDAREPLQFRFSDGQAHLGVLTDIGASTPQVEQALQGLDALVLESNHDPELLAASSYPWPLKARIASDHGHLSNPQSAALLRRCLHPGLQQVVAAHLSERNNRPALAQQALAEARGCLAREITVADPRTGFDWLHLQ
jgi:phosphoribosyl 1,2-cyclic phosphodiesterase